MLALISPAKNLDYVSPLATSRNYTPESLDDAEELIKQLKPLSVKKIGNLLNLSDRLSKLNSGRYHAWQRPFRLAHLSLPIRGTASFTAPSILSIRNSLIPNQQQL